MANNKHDITVEKGYELTDEELDDIAGGISRSISQHTTTGGIEMPELPNEKISCSGFFNKR